MRVLAVSIAPVFEGAVHGGSQRILLEVASALGEAGHQVRLLCSARPENEGGFRLTPNVAVEPSLPLRGFFPSPFEVAPYRLAEAARALRDAAAWADRVYLHADAVFMRHLLGDKPLVRSFHDFTYEEALLSAFALPAALTIVPSEYLKRCIEASVLGTGARGLEPVRVIPNGVAVPARRPRPAVPDGVRPRSDGDLLLLYPHRPDERKGIREALLVVKELRRRKRGMPVRLLVAAHIDEQVSPEAAGYRDLVAAVARGLGVARSVEFYSWLPQRGMPGLYASADATLCIGNFIESFGLVPLESVAAGTPAVCARVGALRDLEGVPGLSHVPYSDIAAAANAIEKAVSSPIDHGAVRSVLSGRFSLDAMNGAYVGAITGQLPGPAQAERQTRTGRPGHRLVLAPWCHIEGGMVYNDYEYGYAEFPALVRYLGTLPQVGSPFAADAARAGGVPDSELQAAGQQGALVADWPQGDPGARRKPGAS